MAAAGLNLAGIVPYPEGMGAFSFRSGRQAGRSFFVLLHTAAPPEKAGWDAYLDALRLSLPESRGRTHVFVATDGGGPDAAQRRSLATVLARGDALTHVFTTELLVRGIVTAFRWIGGSAIAYHPREFAGVCAEVGHSPAEVLSKLELAQSDLASVAALTLMRAAQVSDRGSAALRVEGVPSLPALDGVVAPNRRSQVSGG